MRNTTDIASEQLGEFACLDLLAFPLMPEEEVPYNYKGRSVAIPKYKTWRDACGAPVKIISVIPSHKLATVCFPDVPEKIFWCSTCYLKPLTCQNKPQRNGKISDTPIIAKNPAGYWGDNSDKWTFLGAYDISKRERHKDWCKNNYGSEILDIWEYEHTEKAQLAGGKIKTFYGWYNPIRVPYSICLYKQPNEAPRGHPSWQMEVDENGNPIRVRDPINPFYDVLNQVAVEHLVGEFACICDNRELLRQGCTCGGQ